jgi:pimeloyl-ACP methyl ester carboxylesterase
MTGRRPLDYGLSADPDWRTVDWSRHVRGLSFDNSRISYVDIGGGVRGLVFIHGLAGSWRHWLETLPYLGLVRGHRVIAVDLPGFGSSEPVTRPTLRTYARAVEAVVRACKLEDLVVVGHSLGASVALELARLTPRVRGAVLVDGTLLSVLRLSRLRTASRALASAPGAAMAVARELVTALIPLPAAIRQPVVLKPWLRRAALSPYFHRPDELAADLVEQVVVAAADARGVAPAFAAALGHDLLEGAEEIAFPVLVVTGSNDRLVPRSDAEAFVRLVPTAEGRLIGGTGHMPMLERPRSFNAAIEPFLDRCLPEEDEDRGSETLSGGRTAAGRD